MSHTRLLVLTTAPRLLYIDEANSMKGSLVLESGKATIKCSGGKDFEVAIAGGKSYYFSTPSETDAKKWAEAILAAILS
jgi:hypothetical protein